MTVYKMAKSAAFNDHRFPSLTPKEFENIDVIAGVATGAIGIGMLVANQLNKPFIYVRSSKKN